MNWKHAGSNRPRKNPVRMSEASASPPVSKSGRLREVAATFLKLGCVSFGGPVAHIGYFHDECVVKRRWLSEEAYADLVALCQFLPGPASSQTVFGLGMGRAGLAGAVLASFCFTLPSAVLMILFAYGVASLGDLGGAGWLHGLKLAAVAVVAQAVWGMGKKLCPDAARLVLALVSAGVVIAVPEAWTQVAVIVAGALAGWLIYRGGLMPSAPAAAKLSGHHAWALATLAMFAVLLLGLPLLAQTTGGRFVEMADGFYRAGSLVFGGGHVVLPLIHAEVVVPGWITNDVFLAGYGAAQAVPGPLFTFAGYLGTAIDGGPLAWLSGVGCLLALFLPGWLLIGGALPFWQLLRGKVWMQAALRGANAAVVGVLLAALYHPVGTSGITNAIDVVAALVALVLLERFRMPAWLVVVLAAAAGQFLL